MCAKKKKIWLASSLCNIWHVLSETHVPASSWSAHTVLRDCGRSATAWPTHGSTVRGSLTGPGAALTDESKKPSITDTLQCSGNHQSLSQLQRSRGTRLDNTDHQALTLQLTARTLAAWQTHCWEPFDWIVALFIDGSGIYHYIFNSFSRSTISFFFLKKRGWVGAVTVASKSNCGGRRKERLSKRKNSAFLHTLQSYSEKLQCMLLVLYSTCLSTISAPP